jgi:hypothetical protein
MSSGIRYIVLGAVILAIIAAILVYMPGKTDDTIVAMNKLKIATGFTLLALVFLYGFAVLVCIANGSIDLSGLLSEVGDKGASMSRFQLLIFTMVIALSLFFVVVATQNFPPSIPPEILTLLGISASTYAVSKGIQAGGGNTPPNTPPNANPSNAGPNANPAPDANPKV